MAGTLQPLREALQGHGWHEQPQADWIATLGLLDDDLPAARQPVLPATLDAEAEVLLLRRPTASPDQVLVLRLWRAPAHLDDGTPLWLGTAQVMQHTRPFDLFALWQPAADHAMAHAAVREVEWRDPDPDEELRPEHAMLGTLLQRILEQIGDARVDAGPGQLDDAAWVGWRLCELVPLSNLQRQALLQEDDPHARLQSLLEWISD